MRKHIIVIFMIMLPFIAEFAGYMARPRGAYVLVYIVEALAFFVLLYWWVIRDSAERNLKTRTGLIAHIILVPFTGLPTYLVRTRGVKGGMIATGVAVVILASSIPLGPLGYSAAYYLDVGWWDGAWRRCTGQDGASPDLRIDGCSALIHSGWMHTPRNIAIAYYNTGIAYGDKGEYGRAITNYDQAIQHSPEYAKAYFARGFAYSSKGERERSMADYARAIHLDGNLIPVICAPMQNAAVRIAGCP
jgi:tetratricopeptide (TPR) repeat protein